MSWDDPRLASVGLDMLKLADEGRELIASELAGAFRIGSPSFPIGAATCALVLAELTAGGYLVVRRRRANVYTRNPSDTRPPLPAGWLYENTHGPLMFRRGHIVTQIRTDRWRGDSGTPVVLHPEIMDGEFAARGYGFMRHGATAPQASRFRWEVSKSYGGPPLAYITARWPDLVALASTVSELSYGRVQ